MAPSTEQRLLLKETLGLLASYAWNRKTALEAMPVGEQSYDDGTTVDFLREFRIRHAIAAARGLPNIIAQVELSPSHQSGLVRSESRGTIRGRLDVPRHIARRASLRSLPRRYPIVQSKWTYETPENELARLALDEVQAAMRDNPFRRHTAESQTAAETYAWATSRVRHRPWYELVGHGYRERLYSEVEIRLRRRQTGNDQAYQRLLDWFEEWVLDVNRLGAEQLDNLINGLLAFPAGSFFWDKVFEIWCLMMVAEATHSLGWDCLEGPRPLHERKFPNYTFETPRGRKIAIRFQKQVPLQNSRWRYRDAGPLRGIPDITLDAAGEVFPMLIDAKYRFTAGDRITRSEETYKMLGYAENFRPSAEAIRFRGVLIFPSDVSSHRVLDGPDGGRLDLVAVHLEGDRRVALNGLAQAIEEWGNGPGMLST
jgi:hypothetical protein